MDGKYRMENKVCESSWPTVQPPTALSYRLCGMTGTPHSFRKSHIISIDALSEDSSLYEEALAA